MARAPRKNFARRWALVPLFLTVAVRPAHGQIASGGDSILFRSDAAGMRTEPQYEPKPIMIGPLVADVRMTLRTVADSNIFRTANGDADDVSFEAVPSLRLVGAFGPHNASFSARAAVVRHAKFVSENSETVDLALGGRLDLGAGALATWRTRYAREIESRGAGGNNLVTAGPAELQILQSAWTARGDLGRLTVSLAAGIAQRSYKALALRVGGSLDQSFRDTRAVSIASRASYGITSSAAVFVAGAATKTTSLDRDAFPRRDSSSYTVLAGFRTETNGLIIGEIGIGFRGQQYENPLFRDFSGFTYDATVDWYPTRLVSVRVQAGQDIANSGLANVAGILRRNAALTAYYDPLRNLRFAVSLDRESDEFRELDQASTTVTAGLTGRYQVNPMLGVSAFVRVQQKETTSSLTVDAFNSVAIGAAVTGNL